MLLGPTKDYPKCTLQREEGSLPSEEVPRPDYDCERCHKLERLSSGGRREEPGEYATLFDYESDEI